MLSKIVFVGVLLMSSVSALKNQALAAGSAPPWQSMNMVGKAKLKVLFWDIYNAELYTEDGTYEEAEYPIALRLTYLRDFKKQNLISETRKQWEKLGFKDEEKMDAWLSTLDELWRDVKEDDSITLYIDDAKSSFFYFNDEELGRVEDPEFAQAFLDIWLSEKTSEPGVREKLIS
jgi:hypothetical protein